MNIAKSGEAVVRLGAPIDSNKIAKADELYLAPEVLKGGKITSKSVVFNLAIIWDELINY